MLVRSSGSGKLRLLSEVREPFVHARDSFRRGFEYPDSGADFVDVFERQVTVEAARRDQLS